MISQEDITCQSDINFLTIAFFYISPTQKQNRRYTAVLFWRRHPDLNWGIKVLQTSALPLGYGAICLIVKIDRRSYSPVKKVERITRLELATSTLARWRSTR